MTTSAIAEKLFTVDEYIEFEENSDIRHEFHNGHLYPIEATTVAHNEVKQNTVALIRPVFRKRGCKVVDETIKLQILENGKYVYPDIMITCDESDKNTIYIMQHPSLIIEVLSKSTADYDKGSKFNFYQRNREAHLRAFVSSMYATPQQPAYLDSVTRATLHTPLEAQIQLLSYPRPREFWRDAVYSTRRPVLYAVRPRFGEQATALQRNHADATIAIFEDAGHALFVDRAERFNALLEDCCMRTARWA